MEIKKDKYGRPRVYLEENCPIEELSIECQRESTAALHPPHSRLHVWWARRPLTVSRASIIGSLLPVNFETAAFLELIGIPKGKNPIEAQKKIDEVRSGIRNERVIDPYGYSRAYTHNPSEKELHTIKEHVKLTWGIETPVVLDPFAGGGSIPLESVRLGFKTIANELNPVATVIQRATIEYPILYGPEFGKQIQIIGEAINHEVVKDVGDCFPRNKGEKDLCYIWVRTVRCPDCDLTIPLAPNLWLSTPDKLGFQIQVPLAPNNRCTFSPVKASDKFNPEVGTVKGGIATCPRCGKVHDRSYIKSEAKASRLGHQLAIIGFKMEGRNGRYFREVTIEDSKGVELAEKRISEKLPTWERRGILPNEDVPEGNKTREPRNVGILKWHQMFNPRQLFVQLTILEKILDYPWNEIKNVKKQEALRVYMQMALDKCLNYNAALDIYDPSRGLVKNVFARHDFTVTWSYGEIDGAGNLFRFGYSQIVDAYKGIAKITNESEGSCDFVNGDATNLVGIKENSVDAICVDPPYYDNVMYAECSDFFYVWEKRGLGSIFPDLFSRELTDKDQEAVANPSRFKATSRSGRELASKDYEAKMLSAFKEMNRVLKEDGVLTVMFTHKKVEAWDTLSNALLDAGFMITASWPIHTESQNSLHQAKKNAASSTILLVCRKKPQGTRNAWWDEIQIRVDEAVKLKAAKYASSGLRGMDTFIACFGPALEVISESWPVKRKDGSTIRPDEALGRARNIVSEWFMNEIAEGNAVSLDAPTRFYILAWHLFQAREFRYDEGRKLGLSLNVELDDLVSKKILEKKGEFVRFLKPSDRAKAKGLNASAKEYETILDLVQAAICTYEVGQSHELARFHQRTGAVEKAGYTETIGYLLDVLPRTKEVVEYDILNQMVESSYRDKVKRKAIKRTNLTGRGQVSFNIHTGQLIKQTAFETKEDVEEQDDEGLDEE